MKAPLDRCARGSNAAASVIDERACVRCGLCVAWCPTECPTMGHFRVTPAEECERVDLAIVAGG